MRTDTSHHVSTLRDYVHVVRRRRWVIVQAALIVPLAALAFSLRQQELYSASATVLLSQQDLGNALTGTQDNSNYVPADRRAQTQAGLARVPAVAERAVRESHVALSPQALLGSSSVTAAQNADLLSFSVTNHDPALAAKLATAYARAYTEYRLAVETAPLDAARTEVLKQIDGLGPSDRTLRNNLVDKATELQTLIALKTSNANLVRRADNATQTTPKPVRNTILGLLLGLFLGIGLAFLREALDTRVRTAEEIGDSLELPLLARLPEPSRKLRADNRLTMMTDPSGNGAEAFRMLRTNLEFAALGKQARTVMVTSALEREGKSTTVANLAVALARAGQKVVLVDLDLRRPFVGRFFDIVDRPGVTQVAIKAATLDEALVSVPLSGLDSHSSNGTSSKNGKANGQLSYGRLEVLPAGAIPPDPGEFVGTERLAGILQQLQDRADIVLVDAPPLFHVGDAMTLSSKVDAVLVITRMDIVRRPLLNELRRLLDTMPAQKLGFVVTGAEAEDGYGYGSNYSYYRPDAERMQEETLR